MSEASVPPAGELLSIRDLSVSYATDGGEGLPLQAVHHVSLDVRPRTTVALVGESGSGKSTLAHAILKLLPESARVTGEVLFEGRDLTKLDDRALREVRGGRIGMVFQEPMTALNPVYTAGSQIMEAIRLHRRVSRGEARELAIEGLARVGFPEPGRHIDSYPHELSGGMRQRVLIAIALACNPALVVADEPTSALDTTVQAQILDLLERLRAETGSSLLLIAHDLALCASAADEIAILYAGVIVERGPTQAILEAPLHPYTRGLLACIPPRTPRKRGQRRARLPTLAGGPPDLRAARVGCPFKERCPEVMDRCRTETPELLPLDGSLVRCFARSPLGNPEGGFPKPLREGSA